MLTRLVRLKTQSLSRSPSGITAVAWKAKELLYLESDRQRFESMYNPLLVGKDCNLL